MIKIKMTTESPIHKFTRPILLLHPQIPKPMHGTNPRTVMGKEWWDITRKKSYAENKYCCFACGVHRNDAKYHKHLEAHESYVINYETGEMKLEEIVALCHSCHNYIHKGRLELLYHKGEISLNKLIDILDHGDNIIKEIPDYLIKSDFIGNSAEWSEWHILIEDKKYYSKFQNFEEWENYYR